MQHPLADSPNKAAPTEINVATGKAMTKTNLFKSSSWIVFESHLYVGSSSVCQDSSLISPWCTSGNTAATISVNAVTARSICLCNFKFLTRQQTTPPIVIGACCFLSIGIHYHFLFINSESVSVITCSGICVISAVLHGFRCFLLTTCSQDSVLYLDASQELA